MDISDLNNTSLLLYHQPKEYSLVTFFNTDYHMRRYHRWEQESGTLLTGDINFNKYETEIKNWAKTYENNLCVVSVPHHGSQKSWKMIFPDRKIYINSYGLLNKFGHPNSSVVGDIIVHSDYGASTEKQSVDYTIYT